MYVKSDRVERRKSRIREIRRTRLIKPGNPEIGGIIFKLKKSIEKK